MNQEQIQNISSIQQDHQVSTQPVLKEFTTSKKSSSQKNIEQTKEFQSSSLDKSQGQTSEASSDKKQSNGTKNWLSKIINALHKIQTLKQTLQDRNEFKQCINEIQTDLRQFIKAQQVNNLKRNQASQSKEIARLKQLLDNQRKQSKSDRDRLMKDFQRLQNANNNGSQERKEILYIIQRKIEQKKIIITEQQEHKFSGFLCSTQSQQKYHHQSSEAPYYNDNQSSMIGSSKLSEINKKSPIKNYHSQMYRKEKFQSIQAQNILREQQKSISNSSRSFNSMHRYTNSEYDYLKLTQ